MPPQSSACEAAVAEEEGVTLTLTSLPLPLVLRIFSLLPVDCRLRCSEVCRDWRSVLLERSLWTRLDVTAASGVVRLRAGVRVFGRLLHCAAARAGGGLQSLQVDMNRVTHAALLAVAAANAGALQELHTSDDDLLHAFSPEDAEALLGAAPQLCVFVADLHRDCDEDAAANVQTVRRALRNEAPFRPLRVRHVRANLRQEDEAGVIAFAADVAAHATSTGLTLHDAFLDAPAALDAVVDAALARRMHAVMFYNCSLSPASAPALTRLLSSEALTTLVFDRSIRVDAPAARLLAAALRANSTLTELRLEQARVFDDPAATAELLGALNGHTSLRVLSLMGNRVQAPYHEAAGAALGALLAANAPALTELNLLFCGLGDDGMRPLFEALPTNTHLRTLACSRNGISDACLADVLLPAVRANTSLRQLGLDNNLPHAWEAAQLVRERQ
jgi:hypothetical protein